MSLVILSLKYRNRAVERLGETKKRNVEKQDELAQTAKKGKRSTSEEM